MTCSKDAQPSETVFCKRSRYLPSNNLFTGPPCSNSINSGSCFESGMDMNRSQMLLLSFSQFQFDLYRFNNSISSLFYFRLLIVGNSSVRTAFKRISTSGHKTLASMLDRSICP